MLTAGTQNNFVHRKLAAIVQNDGAVGKGAALSHRRQSSQAVLIEACAYPFRMRDTFIHRQ